MFFASSSSSSTTTTSKTTTTKPNTTIFAGISKRSELPPTKIAKFRKPEKIILGQDELDTLYVGNLSEEIS